MPKVEANDITINYDQQGTGEPFNSHSLLGCRSRLLRIPGGGLREAFYLHLTRPPRDG